MIDDILKSSEMLWRQIAAIATPLDADKPVVLGNKPRSGGDFEAYTDNRKIYINVDGAKFKKNFERIIVPAYSIAAGTLYDVKGAIRDDELLANLALDTFLFVHFHEQFHPMLCPNSRFDEKTISKALYDGIKEAEPKLSKTQCIYKVNNCKNLIWDIILNVSFISKTSGYNNDDLEKKVSFVFEDNGRKIAYEPVTHYPSGILPIIYMISAKNHTTDIPISLVGAMYSTMSYNTADVRARAMDVFMDDLAQKRMHLSDAMRTIEAMYLGFISELDSKHMLARNVDPDEYKQRVKRIAGLTAIDYEENQKYFVSALTRLFDSPDMRYLSLKGFVKTLSQFISLCQKQGSPDQNTSSYGSGGGGGDEEGEDESDSGSGGDGDSEGDPGKSQDEMDEDSMSQTLEDILETSDDKEGDDIMGDVANDDSGAMGKPGPANNIRKRLSIIAADEYYKKNADTLEVRNPKSEDFSIDLGKRKVWELVRSQVVPAISVAKMNYKGIMAFQKSTGLPILMDLGGGFYRLNEYRLKETPLKSYQSQMSGIEIPDNWVIFQDSSGSMTGSTAYVGTKNQFDLLNRVKYGLMKGLYGVCKEMGKDLKFGVVDFSDKTIYKGLDSLVKVYESRTHPIKEVSLTPQCGYTTLSSAIFGKVEKDLAPGKTIYTFITDGEIQGDTTTIYNKIENFAKNPDNAFVFVEIKSSSNFGDRIEKLSKKNDSVLYYSVKDVKEIKDRLGSVLIRYD